jgi:Predicted signal transduction protein
VENPNSSTDQISRAISKDQVLSAKVLKMVNSPIYGFPGRIGSIQHALVLLGFNVIKGIIISTSVFDVMNENMKGPVGAQPGMRPGQLRHRPRHRLQGSGGIRRGRAAA